MAIDDYDRGRGSVPLAGGQAGLGGLVNLGAAVVSIALIAGVGLWGYRLAVRDVSGVPIVRALEGPMRIAPADPGGDVAAHQGLAVNAIAAIGVAQAPAERLVLAPRAGGLHEDDAPGLAPPLPPVVEAPILEARQAEVADASQAGALLAGLAQAEATQADVLAGALLAEAAQAGATAPERLPADPATDPGLPGIVDRVASLPGTSREHMLVPDPSAMTAGLTASVADPASARLNDADRVQDVFGPYIPAAPAADAGDPGAPGQILPGSAATAASATVDPDAIARALAEALADGVEPLSEPASAPSIRPLARPAALTRAVSARTEAPVAPPVREIAAETLPAGTVLVQLGAFDDDEGARGAWARLVATFGDLMGDKALVVQSAQSGGRTFFRLRAEGFAGEDDARRFCSALRAENADCIPVTLR